MTSAAIQWKMEPRRYAEAEEARLYAGACGLHRGLQAAVLAAPGNILSQTPCNRGCVCSRIWFEDAPNLFPTAVFYQNDSNKATITNRVVRTAEGGSQQAALSRFREDLFTCRVHFRARLRCT